MKYILILLFLLVTNISLSQEKWRALTLSSVSGTDLSSNKFTTLSSSLHYDLNRKYFISNWTGYFIQTKPNTTNSWFSTQTTFNRYVSKWVVGVGIQHGISQTQTINPFNDRATFFITNVSYRVRFK